MEKNFKEITDELVEILEQKNKAYQNSYDMTLEKWGINNLGARLDDKLNRISYLIKAGEMSKNGESILDSLFDIAGYAVLGIRFLVNNDKVSEEDINKYFKPTSNGSEGD